MKGGLGEVLDYHNIHVVYTKETETANAYIEKVTHEIVREHRVTVTTSMLCLIYCRQCSRNEELNKPAAPDLFDNDYLELSLGRYLHFYSF